MTATETLIDNPVTIDPDDYAHLFDLGDDGDTLTALCGYEDELAGMTVDDDAPRCPVCLHLLERLYND